MATDRTGVRSVRTLSQLLDRRKTRTVSGAFIELSALANEKERLRRELERWERRRGEIRARLAEIGQKEQALAAVVQLPEAAPASRGPAVTEGPKLVGEPGYEIDDRFVAKEFEY